jgi:hypothetical protein
MDMRRRNEEILMLRLSAKTLVSAGAIPVAVLASGALVWGASQSAFSAKTSNNGNTWAAGTVALSDDDSSTAMFTATNLKPGATGSKCIQVTSTGSLASAVKLYGTSYTQTNSVGGQITLTIDEGTGATFGGTGCTGFTGTQIFTGTLDSFATARTSYANGAGTWAPTGTAAETKSYKFTYTLAANAPDTAQGGTAAIGFTWESQNT